MDVHKLIDSLPTPVYGYTVNLAFNGAAEQREAFTRLRGEYPDASVARDSEYTVTVKLGHGLKVLFDPKAVGEQRVVTRTAWVIDGAGGCAACTPADCADPACGNYPVGGRAEPVP